MKRLLQVSSFAILVVASGSMIGCAKKGTTDLAKIPTTLSQAQMDAPATPKPANANGAAVETNGLHVSDEIARMCNLPKLASAANFEFDSATIGDDDRTLLASLAKCMTEGALRGRKVSLTGRADARGEEEYNMSLGGSRAEAVRRYMHDLGITQERMIATSRGELDATGTDEAGWASDRRVDIDALKTN